MLCIRESLHKHATTTYITGADVGLCQYELASIAAPDLALGAQITIQIRVHPKAERYISVGA